ncbi:MAG: TRAP transporter large permease subunit, partial [Treponema sp.]|nr:TRAP transporter large permease subunit [Treponema sp.]
MNDAEKAPETRAGRKRLVPVIEAGLCAFALCLLTLIPALDALLRFFFRGRFPAAPELTAHILLVLGLVSGTITAREGSHLSISLFQFIKDRKARDALGVFTGLVSVFLTTVFGWCSLSFMKVGLYPTQIIGFIPDWVFALAMPAGYGVMSFRFARHTRRAAGAAPKAAAFALPAMAAVFGTLCSLPAIFKFIWGLDIPDAAWELSNWFSAAAVFLRLPAIIILTAAALAGTPLFAVIGGFALILLQSSWGEIDITASQIYTALTQNSLAAIPLFTLTGFILSESKAGERLVAAFKSFFGWIPGGLIAVTVIICAFFTSFTGASGVTILAMGGILMTVLAGYPEKFAIGLLTASGSIGLLFPPSLPILLVGA